MPEQLLFGREDVINRPSSFIRSHTKKAIAIGVAGLGISFLGDKIDNDPLLHTGTASAALVYTLVAFSWGRYWLIKAINNTAETVSKEIQKRKSPPQI